MAAGILNTTTVRLVTAAGGIATGLSDPGTPLRTGSKASTCDPGTAASSLAGTDTTFPATGRALTKVSRDTIVAPPFTPRLA